VAAAAATAPHRNFAVPEFVGKAVKKSFGEHSGTRVLNKNASNDISFVSIVQYKSYDSSDRPQTGQRLLAGPDPPSTGADPSVARPAPRRRRR
jgi:hypothetical protein